MGLDVCAVTHDTRAIKILVEACVSRDNSASIIQPNRIEPFAHPF